MILFILKILYIIIYIRHYILDIIYYILYIKGEFQNFSIDLSVTLREKCPNTEFFPVRFSCIWAEYGDLRGKSSYSVQLQENMD